MMSLTRQDLVDMLDTMENHDTEPCPCKPAPAVLVDQAATWRVTDSHNDGCPLTAQVADTDQAAVEPIIKRSTPPATRPTSECHDPDCGFRNPNLVHVDH